MRPVQVLPSGATIREITLWKALVYGVLTLGVYLIVLTYQVSQDLDRARAHPNDRWRTIFWVAVIIPLAWPILFIINGRALNEIAIQHGMRSGPLWAVALVLAFVLPPIGQILWTFNVDEVVGHATRYKLTDTRPIEPPRASGV